MKAGEAERFGKLAEAAARRRYVLEEDRASWHDARTLDGVPVEVKACRTTLENGRSGRWWIEREAHQQLVDAGGFYALATYDPQRLEDGPIVDVALIPAEWIDLQLSWTSNGTGHHKGEEHSKLGWPRVLEDGRAVA